MDYQMVSNGRIKVSRRQGWENSLRKERGRRCKIPLAIIGEKIWYRPMDKYKDRSKLEARWEDGVWLGISRESNEILVGTKDGVMRAYAITRRPADER